MQPGTPGRPLILLGQHLKVDGEAFVGLHLLLLQERAGLDHHLLGGGVLDVLRGRAAEDALGERDDDLARVAQWARAGGVRWGLDAPQRGAYRLDSLRANTWEAGWDRVLVGVAMAEEGQRLFKGVLPLDDIGGALAALAVAAFALTLLAAAAIVALTYVLPPFRNYQLATIGAYLCVTAGLTVGLLALLQNIRERKREGEQFYLKVVDLDENTVDPA